MSPKFLSSALSSLEEELKVLRAQIKKLTRPKKEFKSISDLEGLWKGKADFTFEEIKEAGVKFKYPPT